MRLQNGQIINVQAYKHNGELYRQWNGVKVIEASPDRWVLFMFKTKVAEVSGEKWIIREPMIWWMPRDSFSNTTGMIRSSGTHFYTNLASTPIFEDNTIKFIDYDLDIKAYPNTPTKVVDKGEYQHHIQKYNYSEKLQQIIEKEVKNILAKIKYKEDFFDEDVVERYIEELVDSKLVSMKFGKTRKI